MKMKTVTLVNGSVFEVPASIQRIDTKGTHGWQLRYGAESDGSKFFSDGDTNGAGAPRSLRLAVAELHRRIRRLPAPNPLRARALASKGSDLPLGISGPTLRNSAHPTKTAYYCYQVSIPRANGGSTTKSVYIGTENTYDEKKADLALMKAVELREAAVKEYEIVATRAKRAAAKERLASDRTAIDA